jgi:GDPmannose 4,6-dehydratase
MVPYTRIYQASTSELYGLVQEIPQKETTPFYPRSPYACAKLYGYWIIKNYREAYNMFAVSGILFNHESPLRPERFVTQKIVMAAARIASGDTRRLQLGNLEIHRDWGWAPEYVEVMWKMLQHERPDDYVIATGRTVSLEYFVQKTFEQFDLDWRQHVQLDVNLLRPSDIRFGSADASFAAKQLGWQARFDVDFVIADMCKAAQGLPTPEVP